MANTLITRIIRSCIKWPRIIIILLLCLVGLSYRVYAEEKAFNEKPFFTETQIHSVWYPNQYRARRLIFGHSVCVDYFYQLSQDNNRHAIDCRTVDKDKTAQFSKLKSGDSVTIAYISEHTNVSRVAIDQWTEEPLGVFAQHFSFYVLIVLPVWIVYGMTRKGII